MRIGSAQFVILGLLQQGPMSGYDIKRMIERTVGHFWRESFGNIYPTLAGLATAGLIALVDEDTSPGGRVRKRYRSTAAGKHELVAWLEAPPQPYIERNELLLKLFFASAVGPERAIVHLARALDDAEARLAEVVALERAVTERPERDADAPYRMLSIRLGVLGLGAYAAWCRESIEALRALPKPRAVKPRRARS
jgi:PadR family transcriptional regulator, regulatory protein AphA